MTEQYRFVNELSRIINGALRLDIDKVRNYTEFLADKLEKEGDQTTSARLRRLLEESDRDLRPVDVARKSALPVDTDSRFSLVERVNLSVAEQLPLYLPDYQWEVVHEFVSIAKSHAQIEASGLGGSYSILLYGPPGTGKNRLARQIARELGLDLYVARLDGLISSFLGSTSKNIRALFEYASRTPCVLFLDEFDAIAKLRGDSQELGELKRVVNSFIQNLDALGEQSIVIAATNHEELLDAAIWRRFAYRLQLELPTDTVRREMWTHVLGEHMVESKDIDLLVDLSDGFSGSDIEEVARRLKRKAITSSSSPSLRDAFSILQNISRGAGDELRFLAALAGANCDDMIRALRRRNRELYSHAALARLLGISKATSYRREQTGEGTNGRSRAKR